MILLSKQRPCLCFYQSQALKLWLGYHVTLGDSDNWQTYAYLPVTLSLMRNHNLYSQGKNLTVFPSYLNRCSVL